MCALRVELVLPAAGGIPSAARGQQREVYIRDYSSVLRTRCSWLCCFFLPARLRIEDTAISAQEIIICVCTLDIREPAEERSIELLTRVCDASERANKSGMMALLRNYCRKDSAPKRIVHFQT